MLLFRLLISAMFHSTGAKPLPGVKDGSSEWTRSRLDSNKVEKHECSHLDEDTLIGRTLLKQKNHFVEYCFIVMFFGCSSSVQMLL